MNCQPNTYYVDFNSFLLLFFFCFCFFCSEVIAKDLEILKELLSENRVKRTSQTWSQRVNTEMEN